MPDDYDYVVVGGGMTGCGIVAELLEFRPNASILIMDKQHQLGGHWNFAYPYVRLHNFTSYYTLYGYEWPEEIKKDLNHRARVRTKPAWPPQRHRNARSPVAPLACACSQPGRAAPHRSRRVAR